MEIPGQSSIVGNYGLAGLFGIALIVVVLYLLRATIPRMIKAFQDQNDKQLAQSDRHHEAITATLNDVLVGIKTLLELSPYQRNQDPDVRRRQKAQVALSDKDLDALRTFRAKEKEEVVKS